jgi:hypothetical protein
MGQDKDERGWVNQGGLIFWVGGAFHFGPSLLHAVLLSIIYMFLTCFALDH